jgi:hypothetical protein
LKLCSGKQSLIASVSIFDTIAASMRAMLIDFDNDEFAGGTTPIQRTIIPYLNNAIGLDSIVCHTKSTTTIEMANDSLMTNFSSTRGSHQAQRL